MSRLRVIITKPDETVAKLLVPAEWTVGELLQRLRGQFHIKRNQALILLHNCKGGDVGIPPVSTPLRGLTDSGRPVALTLRLENTFG